MDKERILQKIKRCLALSQSANENEAAMALRQAHALMQKHGVSMSDMAMADISGVKTKSTVSQRPPVYLVGLANKIKYMFGCDLVLTMNEKWQPVFQFVGFDAYPEIAGYAFDVLHKQLTRARRNYIDSQLKRVKKRANKTARADSYCQGWVIAVGKKIEDLNPPNVDMTLIENYMSEMDTEDRSARDRTKALAAKRSQHSDVIAGIRDGKKAQLHNAMGGSEAKKIGAA